MVIFFVASSLAWIERILVNNCFFTLVPSVQSNKSFIVAATVGNIGKVRFPGGDLGVALVNNSGQIVEIIGNNSDIIFMGHP